METVSSNSNRKLRDDLRLQNCPNCDNLMGDMSGSRDAYCSNCGYKDPCCE